VGIFQILNILKNKNIKLIGKILLWTFSSIITLIVVLYLLFITPAFQTWISRKAADYLAKELNTKIQIGGVNIRFVKSIVLEDIYIEDQQHDTLLAAKELVVNIGSFNIEQNKFTIEGFEFDQGIFHLMKYKGEKYNNMKFLLDYFSSAPDTTQKPKALELKVNNIKIDNAEFVYQNQNIENKNPNVINYNDVRITHLYLQAEQFSFIGDEIKTTIQQFSFKEKSGFILTEFKGNAKYTPTEIEVANLSLITPNSNISRYYSMKFNSIADMDDYINKVRMYANFKSSKIDSKDLAYFSSTLNKYDQQVFIDGEISGTVAELRAKRVFIKAGDETNIAGSFYLKGLPDINKTYMDLRFTRINSNKKEIEQILKNIGEEQALPAEIENFGNISFMGDFKGFISDFTASGRFDTQIGSVISDVNMKIASKKPPVYNGYVETINLDLGQLTSNSVLGKVNMNATVDGEGFAVEELNTEFASTIHSFQLKGYEYKNIKADGNIKQKLFIGQVYINEPNVYLDFDGTIDLNDRNYPEFNFIADVRNVNLRKLNLTKDTLIVTSLIDVNFIGTNLDNVIGELNLTQSEIITPYKKYRIDHVNLSSIYDGVGKSLVLNSDIVDAELKGDYHLSTIVSAVKSVAKKYSPNYDWGKIQPSRPQDFTFTVKVKNAKPVTEIFLPELEIPGQTNLVGNFNYEKKSIRFSASSDLIKYQNIKVEKLIIDGENDSKSFDVNIASTRAYINDSTNINNIAIANSIFSDSLRFNIKLSDKTEINQLDLNGIIAFSYDSTRLRILPSEIIIDKQEWKIEKAFNIVQTADKKLVIHDFALTSGDQEVRVGGVISDQVKDVLKIKMVNVDLMSFNQVLKKYEINVQGKLDANASIAGVTKSQQIVSDISINQLVYNTDTIGNLSFNSSWDQESKKILLEGNIISKTLKTLDIKGEVRTDRKKDNLNVDVHLNETELVIIEPFVRSFVSNVSGKVSADLKVRGSLSEPEVNGDLYLINAGVMVNYLKTYVTVNDDVKFRNNEIVIDDMQVKDSKNNAAVVNGNITHKNFKDFALNLQMRARNFMCLNTTASDNELYYGTAFASGNFLFRGPLNDMKIDITAETERGTRFYLPIGDENSAKQQDFIRFIQKDSTIRQQQYEVKLTGIALNMNLTVDEDAEVQIILDPVTGEILKGTGNADLRLVINTLGNFEMFGTYEVSEGEYNFVVPTLNFITKKFKVEKGGTIRWNGDPANAKINISAIYETRTSPAPLIASAGDTAEANRTTQRVLTQCVINMQGNLMSPDFDFDLRFPNDENIEAKVGGYLANEDNVKDQAANLLIFGNFRNNIDGNASLSLGNLLNSQISSIASGKYFDLSLDQGVGGSLRLFNDRVTVYGNVVSNTTNTTSNSSTGNTGNTTPQSASSITGDVTVEYKISEDGRFRAKAFSRNENNDNLLKQGTTQTENGGGLAYRIEFDTFGELWRKIFHGKKDKQEKMQMGGEPIPQ
jgi:hypothetical protein